jgi:hypothetical protein
MVLRVNRQALRTRLNKVWKVMRSQRPPRSSGRRCIHIATRWRPSRTPHSGGVQCTISRGGSCPSPVSHRTLTATEQSISDGTIRYSRVRMWIPTRKHNPRDLRMSPPTRGSPGRYRGSKTQVERPILYILYPGVEPLGRSKDWTTSR